MSEIPELSKLLNQVHLGYSPDWIKDNLQNNAIALTITSPPFYDTEIYTLDDGKAEFGWRNYEEYIKHIKLMLREVYRVTIPGGKFVLVMTNTPQTDSSGNVLKYWPILHHTSVSAVDEGWVMFDEAVWTKPKPTYNYLRSKPKPDLQLNPQHDIITIFKKQGKQRSINRRRSHPSSLWEFPNLGPVKKYNASYPSFPDEFVERCINYWSIPHDIVFDPYAGSGQVVRVAIKMGRYGLGIEADQRWQGLWKDLKQ